MSTTITNSNKTESHVIKHTDWRGFDDEILNEEDNGIQELNINPNSDSRLNF